MLIHKDEVHKGDLQNFLSLSYSTDGLSTYFWIKKILEQSPKIKTFQNVPQNSTVFHSGTFYNILSETCSTFEKVPDYSFSF